MEKDGSGQMNTLETNSTGLSGGRRTASADYRRRTKELGAYFTSEHLADWMAKQAVDKLAAEAASRLHRNANDRRASRNLEGLMNLRLCDPAMGDGVFLLKAGLRLRHHIDVLLSQNVALLGQAEAKMPRGVGAFICEKCLYGVDLSEQAVSGARRRVLEGLAPGASQESSFGASRHLILGDSLLGFNAHQLQLEYPPTIDPRTSNHAVSALQTVLKCQNDEIPAKEFSWAESFPEIFPNGGDKSRGFDLIIGNPPWEILKPQDKEFFDGISPGFSKLTKDHREHRKKELLKDPLILEEYSEYVRAIECKSTAIRESRLYNWQQLDTGYSSWGSSLDTFRLFVELGFHLTRSEGWFSFLVPSSFIGALSSSGIRMLLLDRGRLEWVAAFHPSVKEFSKVDHPFCAFLVQRGGRTVQFRSINDAHDLAEVETLLSVAPPIPRSLLERIAPSSNALASARTTVELNVLKKIHSFPALSERVENSWNARMARDLDETNDRHMLTTERTQYPFLKGRAVFPFQVRRELLSHSVRPELYKKRDRHSGETRVVWRDVTRPNMERRMYSTLCPRGYAIGNSLNYIIPDQSEDEKAFLVAVLNSLVFEYRARQFSRNSHMNMFVLSQIPVPRLTKGDRFFDDIVLDTRKILNNESVSEDQQTSTKARIDAAVACMYGLTENELEHLLETYERLDPDYKIRVAENFEELSRRET